ncbi:MAG: response regulator, partial [Elusimicrobiales bacterium]|nr:response regulator [Elusimicrobiales bacterium]
KADGLSGVIAEVGKILGESRGKNKDAAEILIVDDEEFMDKMLKKFLLTKNFKVLSAVDGLSGFNMYKKHQPNLVLLDICLPDKSGLEVLKDLKSFDGNAAIIMVTGNEDAETGRQCLKAGAADYISKPINLLTLERGIKTILYVKQDRGRG